MLHRAWYSWIFWNYTDSDALGLDSARAGKEQLMGRDSEPEESNTSERLEEEGTGLDIG